MDPTRFDQLALSLAEPTSRRRTLGVLVGGALASLAGASAAEAKRRHHPAKQRDKGGNRACAQFCAQIFSADTAAASQCTSDAAHGQGLCYQCGPASPGDQTVCGTTCCGSGYECINGGCFRIVTDAGICSACTGTCRGCVGGVVGSMNDLLCAIPQVGTSCTSSAECPAGQACSVNPIRQASFCIAPC